ncbi:hypothetical protein MKX01_023490 [Papaver californicum]|nr:hypothetical protein MKX01_023490 [Papaver californicum]
MDSGNSSCSLNSSSGGEDDQDQYDNSLRNTNDHESSSISAFLNSSSNNISHQVNNNIFSNSKQQPPPPPLHHPHMSHDNHHQQQQSSINFHNHLSDYLNPFSSSRSNSLLNLDSVWPKNIINTSSSEPNNSTSNNNLMGLSSSTQQHNQYLGENIHFSNALVQPSLGDSHQATRNPKKRTRASRRAPTTVLTTDTSNFRAMVQEFTGIPDAPFSAFTSSVFPRSRFDLFNTSSTGKQAAPPPYHLRPFPQKVNHQLPSSSTFINTTGNTPDSDHQSNEPQNQLSIQNLTFQSLLNPNLHQQSNDNSQLLRKGVMEEFNMNTNTITATTTTTGHGILGGTTLSNSVDTCNNMTLWINSGSHRNENNDQLGSSFSGNYNYSQQVSGNNTSSNCKMNFSGSSTADFHSDNLGFDNVGDSTLNKK